MHSEPSAVPTSAEVTIIGGGILGLFNALQYAKRGISVVLIDDLQGKKRSFKVGESLLIFSNHFLRTIGELDDFQQRSYPKDGIWFVYGAEHAQSFNEATEFAFQTRTPDNWIGAMENKKLFRSVFYDAQIVRPEAEDLMLETARAHPQIQLIDTALVKDVTFQPDNEPHQVHWQCQRTQQTGSVQTRWVIDCSGRRRVLARKMNHDMPEVHDDFRTTAVWGQFRDLTDEQFDERWSYHYVDQGSTMRDRNTLHLWGEGYWMWLIRLSENRVSVGVTFDHRLAPPGRSYREQFWDIVNRYPLMRDKISPETMLEMRTYKDVQYISDTYVSEQRYGLVGDAASIIDAYYSQGISLALVTSWHIANIVQRDLREEHLDSTYIQRVNRATKQDWLMMRNLVRHKYSAAIKDSRYFILSHLLDAVIISAATAPRWRLARWLVETEGDPSKELPIHKEMRKYLARHLYFSQARPWTLFPPEYIQQAHRHLHKRLAQRAIWRLTHGVIFPQVRAVLRIRAPLPLLHRLFKMRKHKQVIDISAPEVVEPAWIRFKGTEILPIPLLLGGPAMLTLFLVMYFFDWMSTSLYQLASLFRSQKLAESAEPGREAGSSSREATQEMLVQQKSTERELIAPNVLPTTKS